MFSFKNSRISIYLIILISIFTLNSKYVSAQINILSFEEKVENYRKNNPREFVYLHTDREVYSPGENINLKAFVRDLYSPSSISSSQNLHVSIYDLRGSMVQEKIFKIVNGQSEGSLNLLGNIMEGEYRLVGWTNNMETGPVEDVFTKKIFLRQRMLPEIFISIDPGETRHLPGDLARVEVSITDIYGKPLKRKKINYAASLNGSVFETGDTRADSDGRANIDFNIPESGDPGIVILEVAVEQLSSTIVSSTLVPTSKTPIWVDFVPEGGLLVNGLETKIGFKAYDYLGDPVEIEGEIIDGQNNVVETIKSDSYGFGSFYLRPEKTNRMVMRLTRPSGIDIDFSLPPIQENGVQLILKSRNENELFFEINTDIQDASVSIHAVADYNGNLVLNERFGLNGKSEFVLPVSDLAGPGVVKVNLVSSRGQTVAHRSVFLYDRNPSLLKAVGPAIEGKAGKMSISMENAPKDNSIISLGISATDKMMAPEWAHNQDIMSWFLLGEEGSFATLPVGFLVNPSEMDREVIENYMLFHMRSDMDWEKIKSGKDSDTEKTMEDFRQDLENFIAASDFDLLITQIRQNQFFRLYYLEGNPGFTDYISKNNDELERLGYLPVKLSSDEQVRKQLEQGQSIMSVLMSIKPYKIVDGKIVFRGNDSFNFQWGVIIVIDGVPRGTDPGVLNSISPLDVKSIKASANIADIQKYSGLNSTGVIEIITKGADLESIPEERKIVFHPTLIWDPDIQFSSNDETELELPENPAGSSIKTYVQGVDSRGGLYTWKSMQ
jgi:hypothetical protein